MDIQALIDELNQTDEHQSIEAKRGTEAGKAVMKTVSAFSNEPGLGGGYILFGLERDEATLFSSYNVAGVDNPDQLSADLSTQCREMLNRPVRPQVETQLINGEPVVGAEVPEAEASEKPVYIKSEGLPDGAYRRISSTDQSCTDDDLLALFQERQSESYDQSIVPDASLSDIDPEALQEYREARAEMKPEAEELNWTDEELVHAIKAARERDDELQPTVAGILLFGSKRALRRLFPAVRVDYIRVPGREWIGKADQRYTSTVEMRDPIIEVIRRAQAAVMDDLPRGFSLRDDDVQRQEPTVLPRRALREAIVNAVMHRDYRVHQPTQIIRYSNRVEVVNAGYALKAEEDLGEVGSLQRNPIIATALHETGIAETKGSGIRVMRREMKEAGLAPPTFESDREANKFTARLLMHHFLGADDRRWLDYFEDLSPEQMKALVFVREVGAIDNPTFRQLSGVSTLEASSFLRDLREKDLLDKRGGGKATYYVPTDILLSPWKEVAGTSGPSEAESTHASLSTEEDSPDTTGSSLDKRKSSPDKAGTSLDKRVPPEIMDELEELGQRANPETFRRVLRKLCDWKPLRAGELADLTGRDVQYLVHQYLSPMVEDGELEYTIPEMPNHPDQAYRTPGN